MRDPQSGRGATILVVDDEPAVLGLMCCVLQRAGHRVIPAHEATDALILIQDCPDIDLLICDVVMPGMPGTELAEWVRSKRPGVRVVLSSGYDMDLVKSERSWQFLPKPFSPGALLDTVKEALKRANAKVQPTG